MPEANSPPHPFSEVAGSAAESRGFVAEAVRKALLTTLGALFLTEEGARRLSREWKLPKELASYVVSQGKGAKDELLRVVGQEIRHFFQSETFRRELAKLLGSMVIEVKAEIRLKDAKGRPEVRSTVKPRFVRPEKAGEPRED